MVERVTIEGKRLVISVKLLGVYLDRLKELLLRRSSELRAIDGGGVVCGCCTEG